MSDYIKDNFLPEDHKEAAEQRECFFYNNSLSKQAAKKGEIDKALVYHDNAERSLKALAELRDKHDKAWFIIKQNEADMKMAEMLVKAYD